MDPAQPLGHPGGDLDPLPIPHLALIGSPTAQSSRPRSLVAAGGNRLPMNNEMSTQAKRMATNGHMVGGREGIQRERTF